MAAVKPLEEAVVHRLDGLEDIPAFLAWLELPREVLSFDLETGGADGDALSWWKPGFRIRLAQFGDEDTAFVFRVDRFGALLEQVITAYPGMFESWNGVGFDGHALRACGFSTPPIHRWRDGLMDAKVLDSRGSHRLKDLADKHFGPLASYAQKALDRAFELHGFGRDKGRGFSEIPYGTPAFDVYSGVDTILTTRLRLLLKEQTAPYTAAVETEMGAWHVVAGIESRGLRVDLAHAQRLSDSYTPRIAKLEADLRDAGIQNPNSKAQKLQALFAEGFTTDDFTDSGEPKLDKAALEKFASPTALMLMEHSRLTGWKTKYIDKILYGSTNGRIYPGINPFGAKTGRQSVNHPPFQQLPGKHPEAADVRALVLPEEAEDLYSIDYDGQEARLLAHYSEDAALLKIIREGLDIHAYTAAAVFGVDIAEVTKQQRDIAKTYRYASTYGAGPKKLAKGLEMSIDEVKGIGRKIDEAFSGVTAWKRKVEREGKQRWRSEGDAYAYTWAGRRVYADQFEETEPKFYTLSNFILQGSGADMLKSALCRIAEAGLDQYIILIVHDELILSVPKGPDGREIVDQIAELMAFPTEFLVPMSCEPAGPFDRWSPH